MEPDKIDYILNHYFHLMTFKEKSAWKHWATNYKIDNGTFESEEQKETRRRLSIKSGWLTQDKEILKLLKEY